MKAVTAVREIAKNNGVALKEIAASLSLKEGTLAARLAPDRKSSLAVDTLNEIVNVLGYKLVLMPAGVKTPGYEIDDGLEV